MARPVKSNRRSKMKTSPASTMALDSGQGLRFYEQMLKIRLFEEQVNQLYMGAKMPGLAHLYSGQEAIAVGVCEALRTDDYITSTHRGHGHCLAKGASLERMFAELLGKSPGYCRGKGGSMHIADLDRGMLGANGIVGAGIPLATGAALTAKLSGSDRVAVAFFGDGAANQGTFHEALNLAALLKPNVLFVVAVHPLTGDAPLGPQLAATPSALAAAFGLTVHEVDGNSVQAVHDAVSKARAAGGPHLIEARLTPGEDLLGRARLESK